MFKSLYPEYTTVQKITDVKLKKQNNTKLSLEVHEFIRSFFNIFLVKISVLNKCILNKDAPGKLFNDLWKSV